LSVFLRRDGNTVTTDSDSRIIDEVDSLGEGNDLLSLPSAFVSLAVELEVLLLKGDREKTTTTKVEKANRKQYKRFFKKERKNKGDKKREQRTYFLQDDETTVTGSAALGSTNAEVTFAETDQVVGAIFMLDENSTFETLVGGDEFVVRGTSTLFEKKEKKSRKMR
jgi:hypothetical protein